jgi:hypothetical protein
LAVAGANLSEPPWLTILFPALARGLHLHWRFVRNSWFFQKKKQPGRPRVHFLPQVIELNPSTGLILFFNKATRVPTRLRGDFPWKPNNSGGFFPIRAPGLFKKRQACDFL